MSKITQKRRKKTKRRDEKLKVEREKEIIRRTLVINIGVLASLL